MSRGSYARDLPCPLVTPSAEQAGESFAAPSFAVGSTWAVTDGRILLLEGICGAMAAEVLGRDDAVCGPGASGGATTVEHAL